jgi:hypothetical protein
MGPYGGYYPGAYDPQPYPYHPQAPGYAHPPPQGPAHAGAGARHGAGMADLMDEIANGGNGMSSLSKMVNLDDSEFWKGALVGAATVLLLTNKSVQGALFKAGAQASDAVKSGVDKVKGATGGGQGDE